MLLVASLGTVLTGFIFGFIWLLIRRSRPRLSGHIQANNLKSEVAILRDAAGVPDILAADRTDAAFAIGFLHAQERFFQMDMSRRIGAGELAALLGPALLSLDRSLRLHQFRRVAQRALDGLEESERTLLRAYTNGVNAGLGKLRSRPFEYFLIARPPEPWREEDTLLVLHSLFIFLQDARGDQKLNLQKLYDSLPAELSDFLSPVGDEDWDAPLLGSGIKLSPVPGPGIFSTRNLEPDKTQPECEPVIESFMNGSNCWIVAGNHAAESVPILANDLHLAFGMPNAFFRARIQYSGAEGGQHTVCGFTIPGYPFIVTGSNGFVSWGLTNSPADWADLILIEPQQIREFVEEESEIVNVKGKPGEKFVVRKTKWGPVIREDERGRLYAQRWVAHYPEAVNLKFWHVEEARSVAEVLDVAPQCGIPAQNFHAADKNNIGWTIAGRIPRREACHRLPATAGHEANWTGWLEPGEYPRIFNPGSGRIWTANARAVDLSWQPILGSGQYSFGARSNHIKRALEESKNITEDDFLRLQFDDRAIFLARWRQLLLNVLSVATEQSENHCQMKTCVLGWEGRASATCAGYRAVRAFRYAVKSIVFEPFVSSVRRHFADFNFDEVGDHWEVPLWKLVTERSPHLLPSRFSTWQEALLFAADATSRHLTRNNKPLAEHTWGDYNRLQMKHLFSSSIPLLGHWLDMPESRLNGDFHMPLTQVGLHGPVQRLVVSPGREEKAIAHLAGGQASNPSVPYFGKGHDHWLDGTKAGLLPAERRYELHLIPDGTPNQLRTSSRAG